VADKTTDQIPSADQEIAIQKLHESADAGNAEAQFRLGVIYGNGDGVPLDLDKALEFFNQSAKQGHESAVITLAWMYANGSGVDVDERKSRELYLLAADHGSSKAQYVVATMYRFAQYGVEKDAAKAVHYYTLAANQGFATAQFALGKMLVEGKMVEKDEMTALQWLSLAHANGSKRAEEYITHLLQRMSPEQLEQARLLMTGGQESS